MAHPRETETQLYPGKTPQTTDVFATSQQDQEPNEFDLSKAAENIITRVVDAYGLNGKNITMSWSTVNDDETTSSLKITRTPSASLLEVNLSVGNGFDKSETAITVSGTSRIYGRETSTPGISIHRDIINNPEGNQGLLIDDEQAFSAVNQILDGILPTKYQG